MGRPHRTLKKNITYHVFSRCCNNEILMRKKYCKNLMFQVIRHVQKSLEFELNAIAIMDNHFHFLITTVDEGPHIDVIMQRIKSIFARRYNLMHKRIGPFWNERYGAKIVEEQENPVEYLLYSLWYLGYNSTRRSNKVAPREYKYSSLTKYLGEKTFDKVKITLHRYYVALSENIEERIKKFTLYENKYLAKHPEALLEPIRK